MCEWRAVLTEIVQLGVPVAIIVDAVVATLVDKRIVQAFARKVIDVFQPPVQISVLYIWRRSVFSAIVLVDDSI